MACESLEEAMEYIKGYCSKHKNCEDNCRLYNNETKIQDDYFYEINDEIICETCLESHFRKDVDDYVG